jgi:hypothetical protein
VSETQSQVEPRLTFFIKLSASSANTSQREVIEVSSGGANDTLRSQKTIAVEVGATVVRIRKQTSSLAVEDVSIDAVGHIAEAVLERLTHRTSEEGWEECSHGASSRHADVVNVRIQWPSAHVAHVVAPELGALANGVVEVE